MIPEYHAQGPVSQVRCGVVTHGPPATVGRHRSRECGQPVELRTIPPSHRTDVDDVFLRRYNAELVAVQRVVDLNLALLLRRLVEEHLAKTGSERARQIVDDWEAQRRVFWHIVPKTKVAYIEGANEGADARIRAQASSTPAG